MKREEMFSFVTLKKTFENQWDILGKPRDYDIEVETDSMKGQATGFCLSQGWPADIELDQCLGLWDGEENLSGHTTEKKLGVGWV